VLRIAKKIGGVANTARGVKQKRMGFAMVHSEMEPIFSIIFAKNPFHWQIFHFPRQRMKKSSPYLLGVITLLIFRYCM
jgi:hypothetical protein